MKHHRSSPARAIVLALALAFGVLACALHGTKRAAYAQVPPQTWQKARGPVIPHSSFPSDCAICHEGSTWHSIRSDFVFDHEKETGVALAGAHAAAECLRCHNDRGPVGEFAVQGCAGCHEDVHSGKLGKNCTDCHEQVDWEPSAEIARHTRTRFPLVGSHAAVACFSCHAGADVGNFDRTSSECVDCHRDQLAQAVNPNHLAQGWTSSCDRCHMPTTWDGAGFDHSAFPLTGQHAVTVCAQCHTSGMFAGTPHECVACHQGDYNSTLGPNHSAFNFPLSCQNCHGTTGFEGAIFNHAAITSGCFGCHQDYYDKTTDPNHARAGYPTTCQICHKTSSWSNAHFNHAGTTSGCVNCHQLDYNGARKPNHLSLNLSTSCQTCHVTATWSTSSVNHSGIKSGCVECHLGDFRSTTKPNHVTEAFPMMCEYCHSTTAWSPLQR